MFVFKISKYVIICIIGIFVFLLTRIFNHAFNVYGKNSFAEIFKIKFSI